MSAPGLVSQAIAAFAVHAVWQIPLLAVATWFAIRIGRATIRVSHALWIATLVLCSAAPFVATWQGYRAAIREQQQAGVLVSYGTDADIAGLPALQREPAWQRMLHRHFNASQGVEPFAFTLPQRAADFIAACYIVLLAFACFQFLTAWRRSRRLVRSASPFSVPPGIYEAIEQHSAAIGCKPPAAALSEDICGPVLAGVFTPTLLLPAEDAARMDATEMDAVLAHELAHLRRRDPLSHALCSLLLLPVRFHPAAIWIASRIRQTREMACDAEAVMRIGSSSTYAHALLQVAERMQSKQDVAATGHVFGVGLFDFARISEAATRDGRLSLPHGPATAGLELFGAEGAMEERMAMMMKQTQEEGHGRRLARMATATLVAGTAVMAACFIQVQPTLAAQQSGAQAVAQEAQASSIPAAKDDTDPELIGGRHAQKQLRDADRRLAQAESTATTDEDRRKIAAAQQALHLAQKELSAAGAPPAFMPRLDPQLNLPSLPSLNNLSIDLPTEDMAALQKQLETQSAQIEAQIKNFHNSPEWKQQQKQMEKMRAQLDSPEFREQIRKQTEEARRMAAKMDTPEFREQIRKQMEDAARMNAEINSQDFRRRIEDAGRMKQQIQAMLEDARRQAEAAHQLQLMAKNDGMPVDPVTAIQGNGKPLKVESKVMAGNALNKVAPVYPASAKEAKIQGEVLLHALIDETGKVEQLAVVSSPDEALSKASMDAVRQWTYKPYLLNGKPVSVDTTISVHFSLAQ